MLVNYLPKLCQDSPNSCWENQYFAKCEFVSCEFVSEFCKSWAACAAKNFQISDIVSDRTKTFFQKKFGHLSEGGGGSEILVQKSLCEKSLYIYIKRQLMYHPNGRNHYGYIDWNL